MTMLDVRCFFDLDEFGEEITDPLEQLEQDNYHRLITPPGQNIDDPDFGLGLPMLLSGSIDASIGPRIEAELREDPRNAEVVALVQPLAGGEYDIQISIVPDPEKVGTTEKELLMQLRGTADGLELL
jgi:hypothetical protein